MAAIHNEGFIEEFLLRLEETFEDDELPAHWECSDRDELHEIVWSFSNGSLGDLIDTVVSGNDATQEIFF